jgi:hypothetical protein
VRAGEDAHQLTHVHIQATMDESDIACAFYNRRIIEMPIDKNTALVQIDAVFQRRKELENNWFPENIVEVLTLTCATIDRLAPPGSTYLDQKEKAFKGPFLNLTLTREGEIEFRLQGVLKALRADYEAGRLQTFQELVHSDLFADFLEMADYLLTETYKDPAAVLASGVLEEHLRKLCDKHSIPRSSNGKPHMIDRMNTDLAKQTVFGKIDQQQVTAWAAIRNKAAHGEYAAYDDKQVGFMIQGIKAFVSRFPA